MNIQSTMDSASGNGPTAVIDDSKYQHEVYCLMIVIIHQLNLMIPDELDQFSYQQKWDSYSSSAVYY